MPPTFPFARVDLPATSCAERMRTFQGRRRTRIHFVAYHAPPYRSGGDPDLVLTLGSHRLGEPTPVLREAIASLTALDRLEQMSARVLKAADWPSVMKPG